MTGVEPDTDPLARQYGAALPRVHRKVSAHLIDWHRRFIALSPFVVLASGDGHGNHDASPRGGPPGFVQVLDDVTIALPDAAGNNLLQTLRNLSADPGVGLLFLIPGLNETLRVNGRAALVLPDHSDWGRLRERWPAERGYRGAMVVTVREAYYHCGRASKFSRLWDTGTIDRHRALPPLPKRPPADAAAEA